ncbi:MAG: transporter substrate-binding domain-containing protein [Pseudomonadota bacterium]
MALALALAAAALPVRAADGCSRPITVPISPLGFEMVVDQQQRASGTALDLLDQVAQRTGCRFQFIFVPRVRAVVMFVAGEVDLLTSATQTDERDRAGEFIHMLDDQAGVVGLKGHVDKLGLPASLAGGDYMVNVVRGFDYGAPYREMVETLRRQHRLEDVVDPDTLVRKMAVGRADVALIPPHALYEAALRHGLVDRLQTVRIEAMATHHVGIYLSTRALKAPDRQRLAEALLALRREQFQWHLLQKRLPPWVLEGTRPVP